jgi:hypothetical protein
MPTTADIAWFKNEFESIIAPSLTETPFDTNMLVALACQETGEVWPFLRRAGLKTSDVVRLCVGDTLDADGGRRAFPTEKAQLLSSPQGRQMFDIARAALVDMAQHVPSYRTVAKNPDKFCRGFGVFQRDLQFFRSDPNYFLQRQYEDFSNSLAMAIDELKRALRKLGFEKQPSLSDLQAAAVAICYNTGRYDPRKGMRQGYFDKVRYYGERYFDYLRLAQTIDGPNHAAALTTPAPNTAIIANPTVPTAIGAVYRVATHAGGRLNLRREPEVSMPSRANVLAELPDGHLVQVIGTGARGGFHEVETVLAGAFFRGFCKSEYLVKEPAVSDLTSLNVGTVSPSIPIASLVPKRGRSVQRTEPAGALSVQEAGQPRRVGDDAEALRNALNRIIDWLAVDAINHVRYKPRLGLTFCNVYAHDYCHLAGVYLPRVWWTQKALLQIAAAQPQEPLLGNTVDEMQANNLFRWLRDFGQQFGWRQTSSLSKIQQAANQGGIGLIVARRVQDGLSGHVVVVVPEGDQVSAKRNSAGEVTAPVQSQAGSTNFRRGHGKARWWLDERFAESAVWIHA